MKKLLLLLVFIGVYANAQIVNIPDANFKAKLLSAGPGNYVASTDTPTYNFFNNTWSVTFYSKIDINGDGQIQLSEAQAVTCLDISSSNISDLSGIQNFTNIKALICSSNQISSLNCSGLVNLEFLVCYSNSMANINLTDCVGLLYVQCSANNFNSLNFSNCQNLRKIVSSSNYYLTNINISNLTNLNYLDCRYNGLLTLDLTGLINLSYLNIEGNNINSLIVSDLTNLTYLNCSSNELASLNLAGLTSLIYVNCSDNQITNILLSGLSNLQELECGVNQIASLDLEGLNNLNILRCSYNMLTSLDLSNNMLNLNKLECTHNFLTNLDVIKCPNLNNLYCSFNQLSTLFIKNDNLYWNFGSLEISENNNLQYICADEDDFDLVQQKIAQYGYTNCHVNSYCDFTPGGTFYTINGTNHYDEDNNGCDTGDIVYPNLKINITNGTVTGSMIGNTTGNYSIPVQAGTHTLAPQLENPSYFNVSPTTTSITFPMQASPFTQDYCMTANGTHHDLEVTIIPINVALPGFDANYKIIYKNKGTNTETATLNFNYDDAVLDFVSATTTPTTQNGGNLVWSLGTVAPFQSGEIMLTLNLNTPTETPPLNAGNVLNYSAIINGAFTDETPVDNTFNLPQSVVNSYDPNDKTCLEGQTISNSMIGQYVHYMIRFENTGTYPAQNIVVKDMIDTTKFDVSTIQMTRASHDCYTRINGNKVEFIFENINLPFDDANNDGYVVFKIKTKSTLAQNSSFSNSADIFFDYNFPITTNTATTNFANLATQNAEKEKVSVYPNPAKNVVNIKSENQINSVTVFDIQGRQVQTKIVGANETTLDISNLQKGNYLLKINTDKGVVSEKIIKE